MGLIYNIIGCLQPISYVLLKRYVLYKMNALHQLFEMSLLKVVNVQQSLAYICFGKNTQFMYRILQRKSLHSPKNRTYLRFFCCRRLVFTLSLSNAKSYILPTNVSFSNGYFPKTTVESMLKFDRWYKTTLFPWYKLRYLISSAKHYAVYKHKAFPPQIQIELTLLLKTNVQQSVLTPFRKKYTVLI